MPLWEKCELADGTGVGPVPTIVPYVLSAEEPTAAVIVCPGGGYSHRAEHEGAPIALWLNSLGISAFVLHYRVAPDRYPAPFLDVERAVRYVRFHAALFNIDVCRVGVLGFSAGGHLASTIGTQFSEENLVEQRGIEQMSSRPDILILCYPVISFTEPFAHTRSVENLLGEMPSPDLCKKLSTDLWVTEATPPTFLWHTAEDNSVPVEHSLRFAESLSRHRVPFELHVYENGRHGLGLAEGHPYAEDWTDACTRWLGNNGFVRSQASQADNGSIEKGI